MKGMTDRQKVALMFAGRNFFSTFSHHGLDSENTILR